MATPQSTGYTVIHRVYKAQHHFLKPNAFLDSFCSGICDALYADCLGSAVAAPIVALHSPAAAARRADSADSRARQRFEISELAPTSTPACGRDWPGKEGLM